MVLMAAKAAAVALLAACVVALIITAPQPAAGGHKPQVAIIGGGIGGASAAYFVRQLCGNDVGIHVFESQHIGGRLMSMSFEGAPYEMGGSMVYQDNIYIRQLADAVDLDRIDPQAGHDADGSPFSLFDGHRFVFNQSTWTAVNLWRMYMRYGTAPVRFQGRPGHMFSQHFLRIYDLQRNGTAFQTPEALLRRVGLFGLTQRSLRQDLAESMGHDEDMYRFAEEFIGSVNRVNYNQNNRINALAGLVSMLPATDARVFKIAGGNELLPQALLDAARVHLKLGWTVNEVRATKSKGYELHARRAKGLEHKRRHGRWQQEVAGPYAAVIIATPLEGARIRFKGVGVRPPPAREYQRVTTTYVVGNLRADYFGVQSLPTDHVLVTEAADTPFSVISPQRRLPSGRVLYKLFSPAPLGHELHCLFSNATKVAEHDWHAYPKFAPPEEFAPFRLAKGIFYNNALENAASAMEMSAVAAKNNALLVQQHLASAWLEQGQEQQVPHASADA